MAEVFIAYRADAKTISSLTLIVGLLVILASASILITEYYQEVAYICPNCRKKSKKQVVNIAWGIKKTPQMRRLFILFKN